MKRILCYGDSNTWGFNPLTKDRFDHETRWTRILASNLGRDYEVIEEGLNGRTTIWDDPFDSSKNGRTYLAPCLESHSPLDLVTIMLGTNDLKKQFHLSAQEIANGVGTLVRLVQGSWAGHEGKAPPVLLLAPPPATTLSEFADEFEDAQAKSGQFGRLFYQVAQELRCAYLDTATIIVSSPLDGIHFEASEHRKLGVAVAGKVKELIG